MTDERWNDRLLRAGGQANAWIERGMGWKILEIPADDLMRLLLEREEALVKVEMWENAMRQTEETLRRPQRASGMARLTPDEMGKPTYPYRGSIRDIL